MGCPSQEQSHQLTCINLLRLDCAVKFGTDESSNVATKTPGARAEIDVSHAERGQFISRRFLITDIFSQSTYSFLLNGMLS